MLAIFPFYSKPTTQKMEMVWNFLMRSYRLVLPRLHILVNEDAMEF
jgi:hypothetical protein